MEKDERKFIREVKKGEERKEEENLRKEQKTEETKKMRKMFVRKFFPNCENSPGGSEKLIPAEGTTSAKVEGVGKTLKKVKSGGYLECSAKNPIKKLFNNAILKENSSRLAYIAVGQSELSAVFEPTNQKPGRSQGLEGGEDKRGGQC